MQSFTREYFKFRGRSLKERSNFVAVIVLVYCNCNCSEYYYLDNLNNM